LLNDGASKIVTYTGSEMAISRYNRKIFLKRGVLNIFFAIFLLNREEIVWSFHRLADEIVAKISFFVT